MKPISISELRKLSAAEIKELLPCPITADGVVIAVILAPEMYDKLNKPKYGNQPILPAGKW